MSGVDLYRLAAIVGEEHFITATAGVSEYAVDGQMPLAAALPGSEQEVVALLAAAQESKLSVLLRGSGCHLYLGAPPGPIGLVLSLSRLNRVIAYDADDLTITVQAGMTLGAIGALVAEHGQVLPLDPPRAEAATIGGVTALNLTGPLRMSYGSPRDLVLGLRVALSRGEVIKTGGKTVKNVAGYDLSKLFVGSLGTVGAMLEITLRLTPRWEERTVMAAAAPPGRAREVVARVLASGLEVAACDLLNEPAARGLGLPLPLTLRPEACVVFLGLMGAPEAVARQQREIEALFPGEAARLDGEEVWQRLRDLPYPPRRDACSLRLHVPISQATAMVELVSAQLGWSAVARAGDGIVHALAPAGDVGAVSEVLSRLRTAAEEMGGFAVLAAAPPDLKRSFPVWGRPSENADLMRLLKQSFDPAGILGCGRFVPGL
jgi:glycolate oxidase FAD binding subunit